MSINAPPPGDLGLGAPGAGPSAPWLLIVLVLGLNSIMTFEGKMRKSRGKFRKEIIYGGWGAKFFLRYSLENLTVSRC